MKREALRSASKDRESMYAEPVPCKVYEPEADYEKFYSSEKERGALREKNSNEKEMDDYSQHLMKSI